MNGWMDGWMDGGREGEQGRESERRFFFRRVREIVSVAKGGEERKRVEGERALLLSVADKRVARARRERGVMIGNG